MGNYDPKKHHRRSIRLRGYDYSQAGLYFITICTKYHLHLFGEISQNKMILNTVGQLVQTEWVKSSEIRKEIELHEFIIMPNHLHGIIEITDSAATNESVRANGRSPKPSMQAKSMQAKSIGSMMAGFKSSVTTQINKQNNTKGRPIWHRNYWEHIIRDTNEYQQISQYIINNPAKWKDDKLNGGIGNKVMATKENYNHKTWMV